MFNRNRNHKKNNKRGMITPILSFVLAIIMVFTTMTPAFASEPKKYDVTGANIITEGEGVESGDTEEISNESSDPQEIIDSEELVEEAYSEEEIIEEESTTEDDELIEAEEIEEETEEETEEERYENALSEVELTEEIPANLMDLAASQIGRTEAWDASFLIRLMELAGVEDAKTNENLNRWFRELQIAKALSKEDPAQTDIVFFRTEEDGQIVRRVGIYTATNDIEEQFEGEEEAFKRSERGLFYVISGDAEGTVVEAEYDLAEGTFLNEDDEEEDYTVYSVARQEEMEKEAAKEQYNGIDLNKVLFLSENEAVLDGVYPVPVPEEPIDASAEAYEALAAADLSSLRLIVGTEDPALLEKEAGLVASYNGMYLLQFETVEKAEKAFLRYYDAADFVTPDTGIATADEEDETDPAEEAIATDTTYTEEDNPFAAIESALESEGAGAPEYDVRRIALIDTGADVSGNVVEAVSVIGGDYRDDNGHGERMVEYILEENPDAEIISVKALGADGKGDISAVIAGMNYAMERGVQIINLSLSAYASEENAALTDAVRRATEAGIIVVGAAGNNGFNAKYYIPGSIEEAIIVGAADETGVKIDASNFGETVDYNVVAKTTSEAAAKLTGFISANGTDAIDGALNAGLIFATDYVAEEETEEDETTETFEGVKAADDPAQTVNRNAIDSWEKLAQAVNEVNASEGQVTLTLTKNLVAATTTKTPNGVITIAGGKNIKIVAGSATKIYRNAAGNDTNDTNFSMFKVENGSTLTIGNNVTLTGKQATLTHETSQETITTGTNLEITNGDDVLYLVDNISMHQLAFGDYENASSKIIGSNVWEIEEIDGSDNFYILNSATGEYMGGKHQTQRKPYQWPPYYLEVNSYKMELNGESEVTGVVSEFKRYENGKIVLATPHGDMTLERDTTQEAVWAMPDGEGSDFGYSEIVITVVNTSITEAKNQSLYWNKGGTGDGNDAGKRRTFDGSNGYGFFVTVNAGGTLNIESGATFRDFNTVLWRNNAPLGVAPIYSEGTINMSGGTIRDNQVSYTVRNADNNAPADITDYPDYFTMLNKITEQSGVGWPENAYQVADRATNKRDDMSAGAIRAESGTINITGGEILDNMSHAGAIALGANTYKTSNGKEVATTTLNMSGGVIDGNLASNNGIVFVTGGTRFNMTGGSIGLGKGETRADGTAGTGNRTLWGGGVLVASNADRKQGGNGLVNMHEAVFVLNGGTIAGNENRAQGGGIMVHSNSVNLVKGVIKENISHNMGGGVYVYGLDNARGSEPYVSFTLLVDRAGIYDNLATYSGNSAIARNKGLGSSDLDRYYFSDYQTTVNGVTYSPSDNAVGGDINRFTAGSGGGLWLCPQGAIEVNTQTVHIVHNDADVHGDDLFKDNGFGGGIVLGIDNEAENHKNWYHDWALREDVGTVSGGVGTGEVRQYPVNYFDYWMLNMNKTGAGSNRSLLPSEIRAISNDNQAGTSSFNPRDVFQKDEGKLTDVESSYGYNGALALTNHYDRIDPEGCDDYAQQNVLIYNNISRRGGGIGADGQLMFIDRTQNTEREVNEAYVDFEKTFDTATVPEDRMEYIVSFKDDNFRIENNKVYEKKITESGVEWKERTDLKISGSEIVPVNGSAESALIISNGQVYRQHADFRLYDKTWGDQNNAALGTGLEFEPNVYILTTGASNSNYKKARITIPVSALKVKNTSTGETESVLDADNKFRESLFGSNGKLNSGYEWATEMLVKEYRIISETTQGLVTEEVKDNVFHLGGISFTKKESEVRQNTYYATNGQTDAAGNDVIVEYTFKLTMNELYFDMKANNKDTQVEKYIDGKVHRDVTSLDQVFEYSIVAYIPEDAEEVVLIDTLEDPMMFVTYGGVQQFVKNSTTEADSFNTSFKATNMITNVTNTGYYIYIMSNNTHKGDGTSAMPKTGIDGKWHLNGVLGNKRSSTDASSANYDVPVSGVPTVNAESFYQIGTLNADGSFTPNEQGQTLRVQLTNDMLKGGTLNNNSHEDAHGKWVKLTFKAALKPSYRNEDLLKTIGWIDDTADKRGTAALPEFAEDLNQYLNYKNSAADNKTNDRIARIKYVADRRAWAAVTEKGNYYTKSEIGDGFWYKAEPGSSGTKYTKIDLSADPIESFHSDQNGVDKDSSNALLIWYNRMHRDVFGGSQGIEVYLYRTAGANNGTNETNWPVIDGTDTHENLNSVAEQHQGVKNQADYQVRTKNGSEYTYKTNIVTFEPKVPDLSITKILSGSGTTYPANGFAFTVKLYDKDDTSRTPLNGTFKLEYKDRNGNVATSATSGGTTITFPTTVIFTNGQATINVLPDYTATIKDIAYTKSAVAYEVTEVKALEGTAVGSAAKVGEGDTFTVYETYYTNNGGELTGSDTVRVSCTNKPSTDFSNQTDYKFEHMKNLDYLGDAQNSNGNGNPDTAIDNAGTTADLTDLYRLTLDITGKRKGVDLLLVVDRSYSMKLWKLDGSSASGTTDDRMQILKNYLYGSSANNQSTSFINTFLKMNDDNKIAISWFGGHSDGFYYQNDYTHLERTSDGYRYQQAGTAMGWSQAKDFTNKTVPYNHSSKDVMSPVNNTATDYVSGYWEALNRLDEVKSDGNQKVVVFLSDGAPTMYVGSNNITTPADSPLKFYYKDGNTYKPSTRVSGIHTESGIWNYFSQIYEYSENDTTYYHIDNSKEGSDKRMSYKEVRDYYGMATSAKYSEYKSYIAGNKALYLYGTGSDSALDGQKTVNIDASIIKRRVSEALDDFMWTINGKTGDTSYPGIDGLKGNTSFYAISYGVELNNEGENVFDSELLHKFAVSNKTTAHPNGESFAVSSAEQLEEALAKAIRIYPNDVTVVDQLSQYVNLYKDDLKEAETKVIMNDASTHAKIVVAEATGYDAQSGEAVLTHYVKYLENATTGVQTLVYWKNNRWEYANGTRYTGSESALKPVVEKITYEKIASTDIDSTGQVTAKFDSGYKMVPEYAYALSFNVKLTDTAYTEYMDEDKTYLPTTTAPDGVTGDALDAITYYRKTEGANHIYVSKAKYDAMTDATEKAKYEKNNGAPVPYYYTKAVDTTADNYDFIKQIGDDPTDYIAYSTNGTHLYDNATSSSALGFQSNHEAWVNYTVNGSDYLTDYYDRPVVQVRPRGSLIIGKMNTKNEAVDHDTDAKTAVFQLLDPTTKAVLYVSKPIGDGNLYEFVRDENANGTADTAETDKIINPGTYLLHEKNAPQNHLAGQNTPITISYNSKGHMQVSFPSGSLVAAGQAGALIDPETGLIVETTTLIPANDEEQEEGAVDFNVQNLELKNFEFFKTDENNEPINHADSGTLATFELLQNADGSTDKLKTGAVAKYKSVAIGGNTSNRYTFVPADTADSEINTAAKAEAYAKSHGIQAGTYWLKETSSPMNYLAGEAVKIEISYDEDGDLVLTFPNGSPAAFGMAGAVVAGQPAAVVGSGIEAETFSIQNKKSGVPLNIRKMNGDTGEAISYGSVVELEVWRRSNNGGTHIKKDGKYYWIGTENTHYSIVDGKIVILQNPANYAPLEQRLAEGIDHSNNDPNGHDGQLSPGNKINATYDWNTGSVHNESRLAKFYLVPEMVEYRVVKNGSNGLWVVVEREKVEKGLTLGGRVPGGYDREGNAYYWIGTLGNSSEVQQITHTATGKTLIKPMRGEGTNNLGETYVDGINLDQHYVSGSYTPNGANDYAYYWGPNTSESMTPPAFTQAYALEYLNSMTDEAMRADGVYESIPTTEGAAQAIYDFVKVGSAAGTTDPEDINVREGIYWLVETNSPQGFFASGKPIRIKVEIDPSDPTKARVSYAGDTDETSPEFLAKNAYLGEGGTAGGLHYDMEFNNYELYELPSAGGPGTYLFTIFGTMMLMLALGFAYMMLRKQRELVIARSRENRKNR